MQKPDQWGKWLCQAKTLDEYKFVKYNCFTEVNALRMQPLPPCRAPGCPELQTEERRGYCERHIDLADRAQGRGRYRTSARERGYTTQYEKLRRAVLARQPLCVRCEAEGRVRLATQTHHIVPLSEGGSNRASNLEPICEPCHRALHRG